jgi:hypothetical protein
MIAAIVCIDMMRALLQRRYAVASTLQIFQKNPEFEHFFGDQAAASIAQGAAICLKNRQL